MHREDLGLYLALDGAKWNIPRHKGHIHSLVELSQLQMDLICVLLRGALAQGAQLEGALALEADACWRSHIGARGVRQQHDLQSRGDLVEVERKLGCGEVLEELTRLIT